VLFSLSGALAWSPMRDAEEHHIKDLSVQTVRRELGETGELLRGRLALYRVWN
jgi:hypothetical protein